MSQITIYTSTQACPKVLNLALDLQLLGRQVRVLPLTQLPAPEWRRPRPQLLRTERADLEDRLALIERAIRIGEQTPARFPNQLAALHYERAVHRARLGRLDHLLVQHQVDKEGGLEL